MASQSEIANVSKHLNHFALELFANISGTSTENAFLSPFSVSAALLMCYWGSRTDTAVQLKKLLHLTDLSDDQILKSYESFLTGLEKSHEEVSLLTANRIYTNKGLQVKDDFLGLLGKVVKSDAESIDFTSDKASEIINKWVSQKTAGKIRNLVSPGDLNSSISVLLINAIYFKATWATKFDSQNTIKMDFFIDEKTKVNVDMMRLFAKSFGYASHPSGLRARVCTLAYRGHSAAMTIVLPDEGVTLGELEKSLTEQSVSKMLDTKEMQFKSLNLYLPKFKLDFKNDLSGVVSQMGAELAFSPRADFSAMSADSRGISISKVIHQAVVEVNEQGTEAAAATAALMMVGCSANFGPPPEDFKCDRPFLFIIHEIDTSAILFIGKLLKP